MAVPEMAGGAIEIIEADWPAPANIHACTTTRIGGVSQGAYAGLNLAMHVGDKAEHVTENRRQLRASLALPSEPVWLEQVHSTRVVHAGADDTLVADAACTEMPGVVCAVLTADCLPVLVCDSAGASIGIAHAGWRGLQAGIISATIEKMNTLPQSNRDYMVWLGPAIGPSAFEVGADVIDAFVTKNPGNAAAFTPIRPGHWLCDLYRLARLELANLGVERVYGGGLCTYSDPDRLYSYRRDGDTGRMASLVWMSPVI